MNILDVKYSYPGKQFGNVKLQVCMSYHQESHSLGNMLEKLAHMLKRQQLGLKILIGVIQNCKNKYLTYLSTGEWIDKLWCSHTKWQPTPVLFLGKFHGQRSLVGYTPWGRKESDATQQLSIHTHIQ